MDVFHRSQCAPFGLVHSDAVQHGRKFIPVFGIVNALGTGTEDIYILRIQTESQVIGNLTAGRYNDSVRVLQFEDIHHTLKSKFVKVQTIAHIIVGRNRFGVIVDHDTAVTLLTDGL